MPQRAAWKAFSASFAVYLLPVVGPHFVSLWGVALWREATHAERETGWLLADFTLAFGLQLAAGLILYLAFRAKNGFSRVLLPLLAIPALFLTLEWTYMVGIPVRFLIEDDPRPEILNDEAACTVPGARLLPVRSGIDLALERQSVVWIVRDSESSYARLAMPGCEVRGVEFAPGPAGASPHWVTAGGAAMLTRWNRERGETSFWYLSARGEERRLVPPSGVSYWAPVLSTNGGTLAWTMRESRPRAVPLLRLVLHEIASSSERVILLPDGLPTGSELVSFDSDFSRLTLSASAGFFAVNLDGELVWGPHRPPNIDHVSHNFRRHGDGWVAWDGYRENGRYRVEWSLGQAEGVYEIPKGRSISSVAVDPWGRYIAVSVSPAYNIGDVHDAVFVFGVQDGKDVYRRHLPPYARSELAFLGAHFFALTLFEDRESRIEVLRIPGSTQMPRVRAWVESYRKGLEPLVHLFAKLDAEGLGQEDCQRLESSLRAARQLARAPDDVTAESVDALVRLLEQAGPACVPWNPMAFAGSVSEADYLIRSIEETLMYEHGVRAIRSLEPLQDGDAILRPFTDAMGARRARRIRGQER